jgi:hypothetical protein
MTAKWVAEYVCDWHPKWGWTPSTCKHYWHEPVATETATSTCPKCGATRTPWKTTPTEGMN